MNAYQYFQQEQEMHQNDSKQISFQKVQSNFPLMNESSLKQISSQNNRIHQVDMQKYKDSPLNTLQKSNNYIYEAGLTWSGSEQTSKSMNLNERAINNRSFKFRDFNQKSNTPQHEQTDFQQQQQKERNSSLEIGELQNQLSDRAPIRQFQTQQNFRSPKKIQFSPQVGTNSGPYYQYINPVNFQTTDGSQGYQNKSLQNRRSILSTNEKASSSMIQKRQSQFHVNKTKEFSTPNNKTNNTSGNQITSAIKSSSHNMPLINNQNGNHTGKMQIPVQPNEKESIFKQNAQSKRFSLQEQQQNYQFQSQKCPQIQMNSLTQLPTQHNQLSSLILKNEPKLLNTQQQTKQITQQSMVLTSNNTPNSSQQLAYHNVTKNVNLSKTFSSPFLKKVNQIKKQNGQEIQSDKNTPQSCSQIGSRTLTSFSTQSNFKNVVNRSSLFAFQLEQNQNQKSREKSSSSDSNSCKSILASPLSPPPKSKLMMEMSKYKLELKEQNSSAKAAKKQQNKQITANSFFRMKKSDGTNDSQISEGKFANSMFTTSLSKTQQQFTQSPIKSLTTIHNHSKYMPGNDKQLTEGNANDDSNLDSSRSFNEEEEINDFNINGGEQSQQQENNSDTQYLDQQIEGTRDKNLKHLTKLYHNSYKNIENILEENKYFQSSNKIEEDMLSLTMKNKLLPRKLGILSLKPGNISPSGQSSQRALKESLNQIFEDESDEAITSFQNLEEKKPQNRKTPLSQQTQSFTNFTYGPGNGNQNANKSKINSQKQQKTKLKIKDDLPLILPSSGQSFLNFEQTKSEKLKQKLNLSYQNIGNNYAEMISKALNHNDLSNLHSINISNNHLSGVAVLTISKNLPDSIQNIDLSNNSIGANGTRGLIPLFDSKKYYQLRKLNLEHNNITDNGLRAIIPSIFSNMSIYVLNISHNKISDQSCDFIKRLLLNSSYLQELYLHWNKISSKGGVLIAQGLAENLNIKVLDLSHNGLGAIPKLQCGQKLIQSCSVLESAVKHLDISYNQFNHKECIDIANTLKSNVSLYGQLYTNCHIKLNQLILFYLKSVHLEGNESQALIDPRGFVFFPEKQSSLFEQNHKNDIQIVTQRIHSVRTKGPNKLQSFDCKALDNCWLCHGWTEIRFEIKDTSSDLFTGEPVFLHLDFEDYQPIYMDKDLEDPTRFVLCRMCPPNRKITFFFSDPCKNVIYTSKDYKIKEFSIPEGMNLVFNDINHHQDTVEVKQPSNDDSKSSNIKDKKQQNKNKNNQKNKNGKQKKDETPMNKNKKRASAQNNNINEGKTKDDGESSPQTTKYQQEQEAFTDALDEVSKTIKKTFKVQYLDGTIIEYHAPTYVNYIETSVQKDIICKSKDYEPNVKAKPRQPETFFRITKTDQWHRGISLFRDYIPDSDALDKRCFEFDWNSSKLPKLLEKGKDIEDCKKILQSVYSQIRIAYKYLSCTGIANDVFCITQNPFSNFAQKAQIIDGNLIMIRDIDFNFISASNIALKAKTYRNPDKALIRNEFLEVMGRIALDKYIRNEKAKANSEAMRMFFHEEGLLNHLLEYDAPQEWRRTRFWNQECDEKLKAQLPFLKILYNNFADSRKNEKRYFTTVKSMSLQEFKDMIYKYDLLDDLIVERDIIISFNLAMMTQVDELNSDRHFQMTFVEFIEAISRIAEKKSMVPLGEISEEYEINERIIESMLALMKKKHETFVKEGQANSQQTQQNQTQQQESQQKQQNVMQGVVNMLKRKSLLQTNNNTPSNTNQKSKQEDSINFIKKLTMKKGTMILDEKKEQDKTHLKNLINKIMNKEVEKIASRVNSKPSSPTKSPAKSPSKRALALEISEMKKNEDN